MFTDINKFDWQIYISNYEDLRKVGINTREKAYIHWSVYGQKEGRTFNDIFDWELYVNKYKDLHEAGINTKESAYRHWIMYGKKEGRNCYGSNLTNDIDITYNFMNPPTIIKDYITKNNLEDRVFYTGKVPLNIYNEIICGCDIGIQIRDCNGGNISGSVVDCLSVDIPVITTQDFVDSFDIIHDMLIGFDLTKYFDWTPIKYQFNGYSDKLTIDISEKILTFNENRKKENISEILNCRYDNYPKELINILSITKSSKIAIVTPYPPDCTGIADFSFTILQQLFKYINNIDIFTDANTVGNNIYNINEIEKKHTDYDHVIYVVGNSTFHTKIIFYLKKFGGACILHDERLVHLYAELDKLPKDFIINDLKGHTSLCFDDIIHSNPLIVHSKKLQNIIKNVYNKDSFYIPFCPFNNLRKYDDNTLTRIKNKYKIDGDINIIVNGRVKFCYQTLKICEYLKTKNIICKIFFVGP